MFLRPGGCVGLQRSTAMGGYFQLVLGLLLASSICQVVLSDPLGVDFTPTVTATCKAGYMTIKVHTNTSFYGAVHAQGFRTPNCMVQGNGSAFTTLEINLLAVQDAVDYCGVILNSKSEERSVPVAVRVHHKLEMAEDKAYVITCGKVSFKNARNETSTVSLQLVENGRRVQEAIYSHPYTLRAEISRPDGTSMIRVKKCFAFNKSFSYNKKNSTVNLIDERGCPVRDSGMTAFKFDPSTGIAEAGLRSMFRFSDSRQVHFQCDVGICRGPCPVPQCDEDSDSQQLAAITAGEENALMASYSVFVLEPGEAAQTSALCEGGVRPSWLLWLCVTFGVLFLVMLIINIFLCSAMTCSCARTEVIEKEPSIIEDYDPYRSWHGSQYGSRYSLNGKPGYTSGGSTMNSTRSVSTLSDHYAIVHSRPGSRYSHKQRDRDRDRERDRDRDRDRDARDHRDRGPPSHIGSHYSGKI